MNKFLNFIEKADKFYLYPIFASFISVFIIITSFLAAYSSLPSKLPLFYSLPWGEQQLVSKQQFLILPTFLVLITLVNCFVAFYLHPLQLILKRILLLSLLLIDLILVITTIKITFIFV